MMIAFLRFLTDGDSHNTDGTSSPASEIMI